MEQQVQKESRRMDFSGRVIIANAVVCLVIVMPEAEVRLLIAAITVRSVSIIHTLQYDTVVRLWCSPVQAKKYTYLDTKGYVCRIVPKIVHSPVIIPFQNSTGCLTTFGHAYQQQQTQGVSQLFLKGK